MRNLEEAKAFVNAAVPAHAVKNHEQINFSQWFILRSDQGDRRCIIGSGYDELRAWQSACGCTIVREKYGLPKW